MNVPDTRKPVHLDEERKEMVGGMGQIYRFCERRVAEGAG